MYSFFYFQIKDGVKEEKKKKRRKTLGTFPKNLNAYIPLLSACILQKEISSFSLNPTFTCKEESFKSTY